MSNGSGSLGTTHLLAYVSDGESAASIRALMKRQNITDFVVEPGNAEQATEYLKSHPSPQMLVVEVPSSEAAPRLLDALADVVHPATRVIVTGTVDTFSFYHWLMGLGIHDYLLSPFNEPQLASALSKSAPGTSASESKEAQAKKTIAVIGARGGVGTTTIASTLANILAFEHQLTTALIDLDPQFGSVALALDLEPSRGLRDALDKPDRIDTLFLERVMMKPSDHLSILSAEEPLAETVTLQPNSGELLMAALKEKFAVVVADLPRQMNALTRHVLAHADHVILVSEPSILSLRDAVRMTEWLTEHMKRPAPLVVVNREGLAAKHEPSRAEFAKHLGLSPTCTIPFAADAIAATARGQTLLEAKQTSVTDPLRALAQSLTGTEPPPKKAEPASRKLGGLLKGRK